MTIAYGGPLTIYGSSTEYVQIRLSSSNNTDIAILSTGTYKSNTVTITYNLNAHDDGGNDACATLRAHSTYFNLYNVNVINSYGAGKQATAVAVSLECYDCIRDAS